MSITLNNTRSYASRGLNLLVYGGPGAGKTTAIKTAPDPIVLSAEGGLLSISDADIPYIEVTDLSVLSEAYKWLVSSDEAKPFQTVCLDSISEIAEVILAKEKKDSKDPRQAYGAMQDQMADLIRAFRDLPGKNVYVSAKMEKSPDENGRLLYQPMMPGTKLGQALPYFFDEVLALRVEPDGEGNPQRALLCDPDGSWTAKDRSGRLDRWEKPDLTHVINKIGGGK